MGVIRPEVIAAQQKRSGTFLDYLAQANQSISQLGSFLNTQKQLAQQQQQLNETQRSNQFRDTLNYVNLLGSGRRVKAEVLSLFHR